MEQKSYWKFSYTFLICHVYFHTSNEKKLNCHFNVWCTIQVKFKNLRKRDSDPKKKFSLLIDCWLNVEQYEGKFVTNFHRVALTMIRFELAVAYDLCFRHLQLKWVPISANEWRWVFRNENKNEKKSKVKIVFGFIFVLSYGRTQKWRPYDV